MKYKVVKRFRDKYSKKLYLPGDTFECDDQNRADELIDKGFIKKDNLLDQNVAGVKKAVTQDIPQEELRFLLDEENQGQARKGVIDHITSLLEEGEGNESGPVQE